MRELQLQPRLQLLADMVQPRARLADIGTDHGYLPVYLLQKGCIVHAIASDIGAEPLEHARRTAAECGVDNIDFRLSDGLRDISPGEADTVVVAGMGGETIISILSDVPWTRDGHHTLLLQPMTKAELLRPWLVENGYTFVGERLVCDKGFLYPIMAVKGGMHRPLTAVESRIGVLLADDALYTAYLDLWIGREETALLGLLRSTREGHTAQAAQHRLLLDALRKERI